MPLPTIIVPGYLESAIAYRQLEQLLLHLGIPTRTVPLRRRDWLSTIGRAVTPIVQQLDLTVKQMLAQHNAPQVNLIAHSAGGWISRIYMGDQPYALTAQETSLCWKAHPLVASLITLGTPHISQERWTRRNLNFVNHNYPGAFYQSVNYVCVAGKTIFGERKPGGWLAYNSYQQTCGQGNTWGDGITPIAAAHLEGAENLIIPGVKHSPRSPGIWYGSPEPLKSWVQYL
ncbi:esterase/lipase family protein [Nodularia chucula]|uniref:esterase/lipase family protein n=1 Tax=Nodularia chucula TaxID=3093667 RepID=UPI0039C5CA23